MPDSCASRHPSRGALAALALLTAASAACAGRGARPAPLAVAAPAAPALRATLDARVPALLARYEVASVGVAVVEDGRVVLERTYGEQAPGVPATPATLFNLASVTKPVAAEVVLRLAAAGRLALDAPMAPTWVDPDVAGDPRHRRLTPRHALAHQTGLPNWRGRAPGGRLAFAAAPGTTWGYSGEGFNYVGRFAERTLGRHFEDLAHETVFGPSGMTSTSFSARGWMRGRLAVPRDTGGRWGEPQVEDSAHWNAANNLVTTPGDYARFMLSVMRGDGLTPALAAERLRPAPGPQPPPACRVTPAASCPRAARMALGWLRLDYAGGPVFVHGGRNERPGGERTVAYFDPRHRRGVVVLTSGAEGERLTHAVLTLVDPGAPVVAYLRPAD